MQILLKRVDARAVIPSYQSEDASGFDLRAIEEVRLAPRARVLVRTGLALSLPSGYELQIRPRSGLALKHGISVLNTPGTIDSDYRGEIKVLLVNLGEEEFVAEVGERIAQAVVQSVERAEFIESDFLDETQRGASGFGSTGRD